MNGETLPKSRKGRRVGYAPIFLKIKIGPVDVEEGNILHHPYLKEYPEEPAQSKECEF